MKLNEIPPTINVIFVNFVNLGIPFESLVWVHAQLPLVQPGIQRKFLLPLLHYEVGTSALRTYR